jgi:hypothetical protein
MIPLKSSHALRYTSGPACNIALSICAFFLIHDCRCHLRAVSTHNSSPRHELAYPDNSEFLSAALDPTLSASIFQAECRLICVQYARPLWLLRCLTIFASPNPFTLFLRCVHHAFNNRFNEAVSACIGFVKAVEKYSSDSRAQGCADAISCHRGLLLISSSAMTNLACDIADRLLATGVSAWWRDRWCQLCASAGLPCKAAFSAPILRALHQHALNLKILADSSSSQTSDESPPNQQQFTSYENWLRSLQAPIACDDSSIQNIIYHVTKTPNGHKTAHVILSHLQESQVAFSLDLHRSQPPHLQHRLGLHNHVYTVIDSEVNAHWKEKIHSPSWGCSAEFRMACVERCKNMFLKFKTSCDSTASSNSSITPLASRFFFTVLRQLVESPPSGRRCTRTEKRVSLSNYKTMGKFRFYPEFGFVLFI